MRVAVLVSCLGRTWWALLTLQLPEDCQQHPPRPGQVIQRPIVAMDSLKAPGVYVFLCVLPLLLSCCTYSFSGLTSEIRSVAIPVFGNRTTRYGIEEVLTRKVTEAFMADNRLKVVERDRARSVLLGEVVNFTREPFSYDEKEQVREYRVAIAVEVSYQSLPEEESIWEGRIDEWGTYSAVTETEEEGIEETATKFAEEVVRRTLEQW